MVRALAQQPTSRPLFLLFPAQSFPLTVPLFLPPSHPTWSLQPRWWCPKSGKQGSNAPSLPVVCRAPCLRLFVFELRSLPRLSPGLAGLLLAWLPPYAQVDYDPVH